VRFRQAQGPCRRLLARRRDNVLAGDQFTGDYTYRENFATIVVALLSRLLEVPMVCFTVNFFVVCHAHRRGSFFYVSIAQINNVHRYGQDAAMARSDVNELRDLMQLIARLFTCEFSSFTVF
jgi:hypothetical protein